MGKIFLSVIIPAYNEVKNLKRGVLSSINDYLVKQKYSWEVSIIDDGSTDETIKVVEEFVADHEGFKIFKEPHTGKGGTIIAGMLKAGGEIVLFTDMDQSTPIDQIERFWGKFEKGFDIVIGSRHGRPGQTIVRKIMAYGFSFLRFLILRLPYKDTQCGFKAFKKDAAKKIFERMQVFRNSGQIKGAAVTAGFDLETLYIARKLKFKVAEVPIEWYEYGERREVSPIKDSWDGLRDLIKVRLNTLQGKYHI